MYQWPDMSTQYDTCALSIHRKNPRKLTHPITVTTEILRGCVRICLHVFPLIDSKTKSGCHACRCPPTIDCRQENRQVDAHVKLPVCEGRRACSIRNSINLSPGYSTNMLAYAMWC